MDLVRFFINKLDKRLIKTIKLIKKKNLKIKVRLLGI